MPGFASLAEKKMGKVVFPSLGTTIKVDISGESVPPPLSGRDEAEGILFSVCESLSSEHRFIHVLVTVPDADKQYLMELPHSAFMMVVPK